MRSLNRLRSYVYATVSTNSRDERAQSLFAEVLTIEARLAPLVARLADWVSALHSGSGGPQSLAAHSTAAAEHAGPLLRLAARAAHQMTESEEGLYAELATVASTSWANLQRDVTSQLSVDVAAADRHRSGCRCRRCAASPTTATPPFGRPPTTPRWSPGRRSPCRARRR